jgi:uncharacterized membrane protein
MPFADDLGATSLMTSLGVTLIAVFLGLRQWYERQAREPVLSSDDRGYFARQDLRRACGVVVLVIIAVGLSVGARVPHKMGGKVNLLFVEIWLVVFILILVLLSLALVDWIATRDYARRHRRAIARERIEMLRETLADADASSPDGPDDERSRL